MNIFVVTTDGRSVIDMVPTGAEGLRKRYPGARFGTSAETAFADGQPPPSDIRWIDPDNEDQTRGVVVVAKIDLFRRTTEDEADAIDAAIQEAPSKLRNIFQSAQNLRSDSPEWNMLWAIARSILRPDGERMLSDLRILELLAPSE